ncbi:uncharacterized protein SOCE26_074290 [Sorangium cellulosum]|uniref:Secreted protein n=1 Tax=Sorangium cellulosum TaxID=56 RepID=A0A2L0F321_SORCE|nr:hypothetical protein [Sorangium cellulosum]AUX45927.1 uncharacterized protein SOCE26_074290 [Sorangium cellulosum]
MNTRYLHIIGLKASFLFTLLMGASCVMQPDSGQVTPAPSEDSRLDSSYTIADNLTIENNSGSAHEPGPSPTSDEYTLDIAALLCSEYQVLVDFQSLTAGQSVEGLGAVSRYLNISTSTGQAEVIASGSADVAYSAPSEASSVENGCLGNPGGYSVSDRSIFGKGFSDIGKQHNYTFRFAPGMLVSQFSLLMLDFGDYNPSQAAYHEVDLTAYDILGNVVDQDTLSYASATDAIPRTSTYGDLYLTGDACTAEPGQPGNFKFDVQGSGIARVVLSIPEGMDPNIGFDNLTFTPDCLPPPPPPCGSKVLADFESLTAGQSVEGLGAVSPYLNISTSTGQAEVIASGTVDVGYGAPSGAASVENGCLGNPGGYGAYGYTIPGNGFSDIGRQHDYTFRFAPGMAVSQFSLLMLDFGDYNPSQAAYHEVDLTAYDILGNVVDQHRLSYTSATDAIPRTSTRGDLYFTGDACTAEPGQPGNFRFNVQGSGITRVVLSIPYGMDPNIGFDSLAFTPACLF